MNTLVCILHCTAIASPHIHAMLALKPVTSGSMVNATAILRLLAFGAAIPCAAATTWAIAMTRRYARRHSLPQRNGAYRRHERIA